MAEIFKTYQHTPPHLFRPNAIYMLTGSILRQEPLIQSAERKQEWREALFKAAELYHWQVLAWVILDNHYHSLVESPENALSLEKLIASYHKFTARLWNEADHTPGRQVWWNYWATCVRSEGDFDSRLTYIFWNPVKHGLAESAETYPYSSYPEYLKQVGSYDFTGWNEVSDVPEF